MNTFDEVKARQESVALEALKDFWHRLPFGQTFTLSDGRQAVIRPFVEPRVSSEDDKPEAGIDIAFSDGSHLEFFIYQTGWGGKT